MKTRPRPTPDPLAARRSLTVNLIALLALFTVARVRGQQAPSSASSTGSGTLQEVIVTAQKRPENAQTVPITINVLRAQDLAASQVVSSADLPTVVPGLTVSTNTGTFQPRLRGIGTTFFGPGIENPVALYVDDVYIGSQLLAPTDLSDVQQISVLYGPQGTLFGRNTTGGVIQMKTLDPTKAPSAQVSEELDNYLTSRTFGYLTGGITDDLAANLAVTYAAQGLGWGKNLTTGDDIHKVDSDLAVRTKWLWTPSDGTLAELNLNYGNSVNSMGANDVQYPVPGWTGVFPGLNVDSYSGNPYDATNWIDNRNQITQWGASLRLEQDLGFSRLVSTTAYLRYHFGSVEDDQGSPIPLVGLLPYDGSGDQVTEELRLLSKKNERFNWLVGAFYYGAMDQEDPNNLVFYGPEAQIFYPPAMSSALSSNNIKVTTESPAAFAQGTVSVAPHTRVTGGVRWTEEHRGIDGTDDVYLDGSATPSPIYSAQFGPQTGGRYAASRWTWRGALDQDLGPNAMAYLSYNTGFKSGGFNAVTGVPRPPFKAETVDAYEVGLKSEMLGRTLRVNTSGFYYRYNEMQVLLLQGCCLNVVNAAKAGIYGVDLDFNWRLTTAFSANGGVEWLHARFGDFPDLPYSVVVPGGGINTYPGFPPLPERNGDGLSIPYSPDWTANLALNYTVRVGADAVLFNVTDSWSGAYYYEPDNFVGQGSYNRVNAAATWVSADGRLNVGLWGRNITNKVVPSTVSAFAPGGWLADYENPPATYGVLVHYWFGAAP